MNLDELIGLTIEQVKVLTDRESMKLRIKSKDGVVSRGTMDARKDRVNVVIEKDLVTKAFIG